MKYRLSKEKYLGTAELNAILKDKQIDLLEVKLNSLTMGIVPASNQDVELQELKNQFEKIKEV